MAKDGTDLLCEALYGRTPKGQDYIGGSQAKMLYDAAEEITRLRSALEEAREEIKDQKIRLALLDPETSLDKIAALSHKGEDNE